MGISHLSPQDITPAYVLAQHAFRAMNTDVRLFSMDAGARPRLLEVERQFAAFEARFSRFRPDSELSRLNGRASDDVEVSAEMRDIARAAMALHRRTGGVFDPAVLPALERAGYDRSFEQVRPEGAAAPGASVPGVTFGDVELSADGRRMRLPRGMRLDFGGIGKGYAVDAAAKALDGVGSFLIDAGGDIIARGAGPDGDGWVVAVADPAGGDDMDVVRLRNAALATSTTARRRWRRGGRTMHHLVDPATGAPAASGLLSVSVIARSATEADVFAKTALILGDERAQAFLAREGAEALLVRDGGSLVVTPGWPGSRQQHGNRQGSGSEEMT